MRTGHGLLHGVELVLDLLKLVEQQLGLFDLFAGRGHGISKREGSSRIGTIDIDQRLRAP